MDLLSSLRPITLAEKPLFDRYLRDYPPVNSQLTFTNLYCWAEVTHSLFLEFEDHLIVTRRTDECRLAAYTPIGPDPIHAMRAGLRGLGLCCWIRIPETLVHKVGETFSVRSDPDNSDYLYDCMELKNLTGKRYDGKRNFIRRFESLHPKVASIRSADAMQCLAVQERWLQSQEGNPHASMESSALMKALEHFDILGLHGVGIHLGHELVGFAIGEPLNQTTFVEHFEKALAVAPGAYQFLLHAFVLSLPGCFALLNREQDLGIPGIRKSKESWHPVDMVKTCILRKRS